MNQGSVVLVDYPFSDGTGTKVRPAVVVQSDAKNQRLTDTIIALVTSSVHRRLDTHVYVDIETREGSQTGLRRNSLIQCENLYTIDQNRILRGLGRCSDAIFSDVRHAIRRVFDL